jgi:Na+/H+-dicarboxylate symporter
MRNISLHTLIFVGMGAGLVLGLLLYSFGDPEAASFQTAIWWLDLFGKEIFVGSLKMLIAPLIFASIVAGVTSLPGAGELGQIGSKTLIYYVLTTTIAVAIGITAVLVVQPGNQAASQRVREARVETIAGYGRDYQAQRGLDPAEAANGADFVAYIAQRDGSDVEASGFGTNWSRIQSAREKSAGDMFLQDIMRPILSNPFNALSGAVPNALGVIFFAMLVGIACLTLGDRAQGVVDFFRAFNEVMMCITLWVMKIAPLAIGCLIASLVATLGYDSLRSLGWYCATVIGGIAIHVCVLLALVATVGRMRPMIFLRGIQNAWLIAFSTTSSAATLPVTIQATTQKLKVSPKVAEFSLPVGATVNMDGTALYEGVAVIFLIQMYGGLEDVPITLTAAKTFTIFITAVLASVGAAAVPSAGLITMAIVASAVGLPLHYIPIIYAVDRLLDMFRTSTNVLGDAAGAVIVHRLEAGRLGDEAERAGTD